MANVINTLEGISDENKTFYERTLLSRLTPELVYMRYGQKRTAPKHEGDVVNFRKFNSISPSLTPLTEGVTPDGRSLDISKVDAIVKQYGDYITISDKLDTIGIDPVLTQATQVLGESAGLTLDTLVRNEIVSGTNVQYPNGKISRSLITSTDIINSEEIFKAVRTLRKQNARPLDGGYYIGIISPATAFDIQKDSLWQDISKYSDGENIMKGEIGKIGGVRFVQTSNSSTVSNGATPPISLHQTMIIGKDAYGV
ncbi:MAG: N4-gp56 family major capsid protein, partial [Clostridia bacterium]